jgi:hypothetical protein
VKTRAELLQAINLKVVTATKLYLHLFDILLATISLSGIGACVSDTLLTFCQSIIGKERDSHVDTSIHV